ncbi:LytTR family transcriptional regulator|uniref:LytTr DNA-binding domain-containing protein n=1 Tax=Dendrosporobacter quercicolus TaxID=146817 RepID=A0A1G9WAY5_9FIRM|nr:LytTR family DNA-binding domain-containing protein [Dendrosporobacter quercicolus]NSL47673.1 LytTR family transcriptional regulator [Dendrosporobacter quercicolus DSM 1736]SDM81366.1 LytTr DNA-binding domain-containing protein [Dendrosporobacter quercicolus]
MLKVSLDEITALETVNRKVAVYLLDKTIYYTGKLTELSEQFPRNMFIRCHQSFALNIRNIRELNKSHAVAVNGKVIPVSRSHLKSVQKAFLEWLGS